MILIISTDDDITTKKVQKWLAYYNEEFVRINDSSKVMVLKYKLETTGEIIELSVSNGFFTNEVVKLNEVKAVWYRRGFLNINIQPYSHPNLDLESNNKINDYLFSEKIILKGAIIQYLGEKNSVNSEFDTRINKLTVLRTAKRNGLDIPSTIVSSSKEELNKFIKIKKNCITKAINNGHIRLPNWEVGGGTEVIKDTDFIDESTDHIFPSLLQEKLDKAYELRIFFIFKEYYASAIFSQSSKKTKVDFRNYDIKNQNRVVPFKLPTKTKNRLIKTMKDIKLNCGSIDMVVTKNGRFVFLEVNPIGQFEQVSYPCNYFIERRIAQILIEIKNGKKYA